MMDENFLLNRKRAMRLLDEMKAGPRPGQLYVFSSANAIGSTPWRNWWQLGVSWVWMGLESPHASYVKLAGARYPGPHHRTA